MKKKLCTKATSQEGWSWNISCIKSSKASSLKSNFSLDVMKKKGCTALSSCFWIRSKGAVAVGQNPVNTEWTRDVWTSRGATQLLYRKQQKSTWPSLQMFTDCLHNFPSAFFFPPPIHTQHSRAFNRAFANREAATEYPYKSIIRLQSGGRGTFTTEEQVLIGLVPLIPQMRMSTEAEKKTLDILNRRKSQIEI